jgi:hypothetical protein
VKIMCLKNSNHLTMVMSLCAQAHRRWDHHANQMWDGKIGIWPIGGFVPAQQRTSMKDCKSE